MSADPVVLPNTFLGSYAALGKRLQGKAAGTELRAYIAPQGEVAIKVTAVAPERMDTPKGAFAATRYALTFSTRRRPATWRSICGPTPMAICCGSASRRRRSRWRAKTSRPPPRGPRRSRSPATKRANSGDRVQPRRHQQYEKPEPVKTT